MQELIPVTGLADIEAVVKLAKKIWRQHFVPIIGQGQVDYMLGKFQTAQAIEEQIAEGYEYYLLYHQESPLGYLSIRAHEADGKMMISKIYVDAKSRGGGHGRFLLDFVGDECRRRRVGIVRLTVNKQNEETIAWYQRRGFQIVDQVKMDIGQGYYMDDFVMELHLS